MLMIIKLQLKESNMNITKINLNDDYGCGGYGELTIYSTSSNRPLILVIPGGAYTHLSTRESHPVVEKFLSMGYDCALLMYSVAPTHFPVQLNEVNKSIEHLSKMYKNIFVMGFSAGGHLTMSSYVYNTTDYKPSFLCPIYPVVSMSNKDYTHHRSRRGALGVWGQWNQTMQDSLSIENHIPSDCPPVFLVNCIDDPVVKYQNSELLDSALHRARIPHTYIQYKTGGHGFGASDIKGSEECHQWKNEFIIWILNFKAQKQ